VILSADATEATRAPLLERGAHAFMTKPIGVQALLGLVDQYAGETEAVAATKVTLDDRRIAELEIFTDAQLQKLVADVISAISELLDRVTASVAPPAQPDFPQLEDVAHRGRNDALVVGASELADALGQLELAAREGHLAAARATVSRLHALWPATQAAIERIAATHS
jgi:hypothetical protein